MLQMDHNEYFRYVSGVKEKRGNPSDVMSFEDFIAATQPNKYYEENDWPSLPTADLMKIESLVDDVNKVVASSARRRGSAASPNHHGQFDLQSVADDDPALPKTLELWQSAWDNNFPLKDVHVRLVAEAMKTNTRVRTLDISGWGTQTMVSKCVTDVGGQALLDMLRVNTTVREIKLIGKYSHFDERSYNMTGISYSLAKEIEHLAKQEDRVPAVPVSIPPEPPLEPPRASRRKSGGAGGRPRPVRRLSRSSRDIQRMLSRQSLRRSQRRSDEEDDAVPGPAAPRCQACGEPYDPDDPATFCGDCGASRRAQAAVVAVLPVGLAHATVSGPAQPPLNRGSRLIRKLRQEEEAAFTDLRRREDDERKRMQRLVAERRSRGPSRRGLSSGKGGGSKRKGKKRKTKREEAIPEEPAADADGYLVL